MSDMESTTYHVRLKVPCQSWFVFVHRHQFIIICLLCYIIFICNIIIFNKVLGIYDFLIYLLIFIFINNVRQRLVHFVLDAPDVRCAGERRQGSALPLHRGSGRLPIPVMGLQGASEPQGRWSRARWTRGSGGLRPIHVSACHPQLWLFLHWNSRKAVKLRVNVIMCFLAKTKSVFLKIING